MKKLEIKHVRLIYDEWKCIERKSYRQKRIKNPDFSGFLALIDIEKVKEKQVWSWGKESLTVCDDGMKWLIIVPENEKYAVTVYMNQEYRPVFWYIDIIDGIGVDEDGMFFVSDLFLDLLVSPEGEVKEEDRDELEAALEQGVITECQFAQADRTAQELRLYLEKNFQEFRISCGRRLEEIMVQGN